MLDPMYHYVTLMRFIVDNNLISSICGVTIGFVIATAVKSLVSDILVPLFYTIVYLICYPLRHTAILTKLSAFTNLKLDKFLKELINLILIIVCAYFIFIKVLNKFIMAKKAADAANKSNRNGDEWNQMTEDVSAAAMSGDDDAGDDGDLPPDSETYF